MTKEDYFKAYSTKVGGELVLNEPMAYRAMQEYADSLLSEKESLIIELTNKVVEQEGGIQRLKVVVSRAFDIDYYPNGDISAAWEDFRKENNL